MYDRFLKLIQSKGVTVYRVAKDTGIPYTTFANWKSGKSEPGVKKLYKISKYLGVQMEYFVEGEE